MRGRVEWLQARLYPDPATRDAVGVFLLQLETALQPSFAVLDIGAGAGLLNRYHFRGNVRQMIGIDVDPRVTENPLLDVGLVSDGSTIPLEANSIDLAFSIYVQEHVSDPFGFAREIHRVLKPGGIYMSLTPNRFHYVPLVATLTPTRFHRWLNARRGRAGEDTFPTYYRLNSFSRIRDVFDESGFEHCDVVGIEVEPQYLKFHPATYLLGTAYERVVNSTDILSHLRVNLITRCTNGA